MKLAQTKQQQAYWKKLQPVNRVTASDTYKRTMSGSSKLFELAEAAYNLAARRGPKELRANGRLVVAGIEKTLYPWFMDPIRTSEIDEAQEFFTTQSQVKKFPKDAWQLVKDNGGYMPLDIYGLPGGQTTLIKDGKHVPIFSVEGTGALASHLEPQLETMYQPMIAATKAKLMRNVVGDRHAEFGLRSDSLLNNHPAHNMAIYVGSGFYKTSDDQSVFLFPELFEDIGTMGHEFVMAYQREGESLESAQEKAFDAFVEANEVSALLPDVVSTRYSGLPAIKRQIRKNLGNGKIIKPRFDSGDVASDTVYWRRDLAQENLPNTGSVVEDGYNPTKAQDTVDKYAMQGGNAEDIFVGAGGYFFENNSRDTISLAYKRSATQHEDGWHTSMKFSDSPGKQSIPGKIRIYGRDNTLIVAQEGESIEGKLLSVPLVKNGRYVYDETLPEQHKRTEQTWNQYNNIEYSIKTQELIDARTQEKEAILAAYVH